MIIFLRLTEDIKNKTIHPHSKEPVMSLLYSLNFAEKLNLNYKYIDTNLEKHNTKTIINKIKKSDPETLIIDTKITTYNEAIEIINNKPKKTKIIIVGQQITSNPDSFIYKNSKVHFGILGEYELTLKNYLKDPKQYKKLTGITYYDKKPIVKKINIIKNLDELSIPKYISGFYTGYPTKTFKSLKWGYIETTRGCPFNCAFCSQTLRISYGSTYRRRSIKTIIDEIKHLLKQNVNAIRFLDDNFINDKKYITTLCKSIIKQKLKFKWVIQTRVELIDEEILYYLKKANCSTICVGVESGENRILNILNKNITKNELEKKIKLIKKFKIWIVNFFMIGNPTETKKEILNTIKFCKKLKPEIIQVAFFTAYPGSKYYNKIPLKDKNKNIYLSHYNKLKYNFSKVSTKELVNLQKEFYKKYFLSFNYLITIVPKITISYLFNFKYFYKLIINTLKFMKK